MDERLERDPLASLARRSGDAKAEKAVGGNRRSMRMKRHAGVIRALVDETPDKECRTALAVRGVSATLLASRLAGSIRAGAHYAGEFALTQTEPSVAAPSVKNMGRVRSVRPVTFGPLAALQGQRSAMALLFLLP